MTAVDVTSLPAMIPPTASRLDTLRVRLACRE